MDGICRPLVSELQDRTLDGGQENPEASPPQLWAFVVALLLAVGLLDNLLSGMHPGM
jgi:hypothetical protein